MFEDEDDVEVDEKALKVDVLVRAGQYHAVEFSTTVEIDLTAPVEASGKLRDAVQILRNALPVAELKCEDREHLTEQAEMVINKTGSVRIAPAGTIKAERELEQFKKAFPIDPPEKPQQ